MSSLKDAVRRLQVIDAACNPKNQESSAPASDEFTKIKKEISSHLKMARKLIQDRDDMSKTDKNKKMQGTKAETADLSFRIRSEIKEAKELILQIEGLVKKSERKLRGKNRGDLQEIIDSRKEIVKLCYQHLEECENLDKARFNEGIAQDRVNLFTSNVADGAIKINVSGMPTSNNPVAPTNDLPDIEVAEDLAMIRQRGMDIDQELDEIAAGVSVIKQIAIQMGDEVGKQNEMLDDVDDKVDRTQAHADKVNEKMKEALDGMMKGDKFMVNCILICILLGLISYIASIVI